ncbi:hypothetical protein [Brevibacillus laterosporus]|uniref:hypothetical protein n=1 Tax=Brevibacillus laterosporus TaxID=1465 RepID=UPI00265151A1|nr:hypothetical protein [Brevibacillus laterosporus]MDN9009802.1 hypothetical protein [Brevibacillus laterosporus]MDO0940816.1 hypothetical protein [Brevibacillus laterosporus]
MLTTIIQVIHVARILPLTPTLHPVVHLQLLVLPTMQSLTKMAVVSAEVNVEAHVEAHAAVSVVVGKNSR